MRTPGKLAATGAIGLVAVVTIVGVGCRRKTERPAAAPGRAQATYTVRGEIVQLPSGSGRDLVVRHEAIPDFVDQSGAKVGMEPMIMPFSLAPGLDLSGMTTGDKVRFVLVVDWDQLSYRITGMEKLPPGTALHFGPPDGSPTGGSHTGG